MKRTKGLQIKTLPDAINTSITKDFTQVPNELLRRSDLSFKAKGLLCLLLSNREGWHSYITTIQQMTSEGVSAIQSGIAELEKTGYLLRVQYREKRTKIRRGSFWAYTDLPGNFDMQDTLKLLDSKDLEPFVLKKNLPENLNIENLLLGSRLLGNPPLIIPSNKNTNNNNTNKRSLSEETSDSEPLKEKNLSYIPFMEKLLTIVRTKKNIKVSAHRKNKWATEIRQLVELDGVSPDRVQKALDWYSIHIGEEFCPEIEGGSSLRSKFLRLEAAMQRNNGNGKKTNKGVTIGTGYTGRYDHINFD